MSPLKHETVRGQPIRLGARTITPEARVWSWQTKEVIIQDAGHASGRGAAFAWAYPTALIDRAGDQTRRFRIVDANRQLEVILLIAAMLLPLVLNAFMILAQRVRTQATP